MQYLAHTDKVQLEAALALARKGVELGKGGEWGEWMLLALGMAEYRSGNDGAAQEALHAAVAAAAKAFPDWSRTPTAERSRLLLAIADRIEARLEESWKHPVLNYSLSYARTIELEARLLEKEWTGEPGLFARSRLR